MSSSSVRTKIKDFLSANSTEKVMDLSGQFDNLQDMLADAGIGTEDPWVGVQFIGSDEVPITIGSSNTSGKYRETGAVYIHVVDIAKMGVSDTILSRAEILRNLFRGQEIGSLLIDSVAPINFENGAALHFEDGWISGSFVISYTCDLDL